MRGSPLFRAALTLAALLILLWPLHRLTSHETRALPASSATAPQSVEPVEIAITSTASPFKFQVSHLGRVIWEGASDESKIARSFSLPFPTEGIDLTIDASWTQEKEAAVRVDVTPANNAPITHTLWGAGKVSDVLTFTP
jgi:hypothetical protein